MLWGCSLRAPHPSKTLEGWGAHAAEKHLLAPIVSQSLRDLSCRITANRRRASFDGNACVQALLCRPSCRSTAGGSSRTVPLSSDTEEAVMAVAATAVVVTEEAATAATAVVVMAV